MKQRHVILISCFVCWLAAVPAAWAGWYVPAQVTVQGERILLGDLVRADDGAATPTAWGDTFLSRAPDPGKERTLSAAYIGNRLRAVGLADDVRVPEQVTVRRPGQEIDPAIGERAILAYIRANAPWSTDQYTVEIVRRHPLLRVEPGPLTAHLIHLADRSLAGRRTYQVEYRLQGRKVAQGSFSVDVHVMGAVYVAAHKIARGTVLAEMDLLKKTVDLAMVKTRAITVSGQLIGAQAVRAIREGEILSEANITQTPLVKRGDVVTLIVRRSGMLVATFALAREDGRAGEVIKVDNLQSKKQIHARVVDATTVQVIF